MSINKILVPLVLVLAVILTLKLVVFNKTAPASDAAQTQTPTPIVTPTPASPAPIPSTPRAITEPQYKIAFVRASDIYVMNVDGSNQTRLTNLQTTNSATTSAYVPYAYSSSTNNYPTELKPTWSPDGTKIAFASASRIYVMNADGSKQVSLGGGAYPAWSPDGTKIAFESSSEIFQSSGEIYVMNADGTKATRVTNNYPYYSTRHSFDNRVAMRPAWSPDGTQIAFVSARLSPPEDFSIYVVNADGTGQKQVTNLADAYIGSYNPPRDIPFWSPDCKKIAFSSGCYSDWGVPDIFVINSDGTNLTRLTNDGEYKQCGIYLQWSPDSTKIAFSSNRSGSSQIYIMNADGSHQTCLTCTESPGYGSPFSVILSNDYPTWSPDGSKIAFVSSSDIYVMNADGSNQIKLAEGTSPIWSPRKL